MCESEKLGIETTKERASSLFKFGKICVINTDIDGILTGLLVQNVLGWKVVGFYDSKDTLFIDRAHADQLLDAVFIDVFIAPPQVKCIDQHIVAQDADHACALASNPVKLNPNLQRTRYASRDAKDLCGYAWKYPFGSFHYVLACLEGIGRVDRLNLEGRFSASVSTLDLILRADDAARTTAENYVANAKDWWGWLQRLGGKGTKAIAEYALSTTPGKATEAYDSLATTFRREYGCHTNDGNFSRQLKKSGGDITDSIKRYFDSVAESIGLAPLNLQKQYAPISGEFLTAPTYERDQVRRLLGRPDLFSYAFTYCMGPLAAKGFSFTLWPPDGLPRMT